MAFLPKALNTPIDDVTETTTGIVIWAGIWGGSLVWPPDGRQALKRRFPETYFPHPHLVNLTAGGTRRDKIPYGPAAPLYRVTIQLVANLPLTSEQRSRFGLARPGQARPKRNFCYEDNGRFATS